MVRLGSGDEADEWKEKLIEESKGGWGRGWRLCREGKVPGFKFGGQWRFNKKDIDLLSKKSLRKR